MKTIESMSEERRITAGDWLLRLQASELDPQELSEWLEWYHADTRNGEVFEALQAEFEGLRAIPKGQRAGLAKQLMESSAVPLSAKQKRPAIPWKSLAIAAGLVAIVLGSALLVQRSGPWSSAAPPMQTAQYQTQRAQHQVVSLPDGSKVDLGAHSSVSLNFTVEARYVVLEGGEAFFEVAHDVARPFIVQVGGITVRAVGTQFNIRRAEERVVVAVTEGAVDVGQKRAVGGASSLRLRAGEQVNISPSQALVALTHADAPAIGAWRSGRLEFVNEPLSSVIETVNRYSSREIVLTQHDIASLSYTGTVSENRIDEWLLALPDVFPVQISQIGGETILVSARK